MPQPPHITDQISDDFLASLRRYARDASPGIITSFDYPPIPDRRFDWSAKADGYEPGEPIGHGRTEVEAIADLKDQLADSGGDDR